MAEEVEGKDEREDNFTPEGEEVKSEEGEVKADEQEATKVDAEAKTEDDKGPKKDRMVPETRLSETVRKHKDREAALVAQIKEMEAEREAARADADLSTIERRIDDLEDKYNELMKDGKDAEAKSVRAEQRRLERALVRAEVEEKGAQARIAAVEEMRYEATINRLEAQYPVINEDHDDYDEELANEIIVLRNSLRSEGSFTPAKALEKAVAYVMKAHGISPLGEEAPDAKRTRKEQEARKRAAEDNKRQPADINKRGLDSDKRGGPIETTNVARLSQEQFAKLDEETLSRLRGDVL